MPLICYATCLPARLDRAPAYTLTNGSTAFVQAEARNGKPCWQQPIAAQHLCSSFITANGKLVEKLDASLRDPLKKGSKDSSLSLDALEQLLSKSNVCVQCGQRQKRAYGRSDTPSPHRRPILLAVDGIEALFRQTDYVDPNGGRIPASQLALPALLASYLSGTSKLTAGSVIGAFDKATASIPSPKGASVQVEALDRQEAAGIYEHLFKTDMLSGRESSPDPLPPSAGLARIVTRKLLTDEPSCYLHISSSLGCHLPRKLRL